MADLTKLRDSLRDMASKKRKAKEQEDKKRSEQNDADRKTMLESMSKDFGQVFEPYLAKLQQHSQLSSEELSRIIAESVKVDVPGLDTRGIEAAIEASIAKAMGAVRIPTPQAHVNIPPINIPPMQMPDEMNIRGWISIMGYDKGLLSNPLPVQIRDANGKPVDLRQQAIAMAGGGGGKMDFFTIVGIQNTVGVVTINPDGSPVYPSAGVAGASSSSVSLVNSDGSYYNSDNPLPVTFAAAASQPVSQVSGAAWSTFITGAAASTYAELLNPDGRVKVENVGGLTNTEIRAAALEMIQVSGSVFSTNIVGPVGPGDSATALRILQAGDSVASVIINDSLITFKIDQVSGAVFSVSVVGPVGQGDAASAMRVVIAGNSDASVVVNSMPAVVVTSITNSVAASLVDSGGVQYSGSNPLPVVFGATATQGVNVVDSSGIGYSGSNPLPTAVTGITNSVAVVSLDRDGNPLTTGPIGNGDQATALRIVQAGDAVASVVVNSMPAVVVTSITNSVAAALVDSSNVQYSGSNPLPVTLITGALTSTLSVGDSAARAADNGGNPVKVGGIARQTNPTAFADGDRSNMATDDLGRQITRPIQVRDLTKTAYVSVTNGTEATLLAAVAGAFLDCVAIMGSNNSDAAISVDIRCTTAGNVVHTLRIPANATAGWTPPIPWPQDATGNNWTVDLPDVTGSTLTFSALFSQEV